MIPIAKPYFTNEEPQAAYDVVASKWLFQGPKVKSFEEKFSDLFNVKHCVAVNSGSSALLIAQMALDVQPNDEVITSDMTFVSSATSCMFLGAKPIFCDISLNDYNIEPKNIEKKINQNTKVIIPVHYAGQPANMDEIVSLGKKYNIPILEDAAEAHLSEFNSRKSGTIGDIGIFSFTPSKLMTTGEGGMIVTNNDLLAEKCRYIRNFGDKNKFEWEMLGFNFRMMDINAAIGLVQLKYLPEFIEKRVELANKYINNLKDVDNIILPKTNKNTIHNYQLFTIRINHNELKNVNLLMIENLKKLGINSRLYYPALHQQNVFKKYGPYNDFEYKNTLVYTNTAFSIPIYPGLSDSNLKKICESIKQISKQISKTIKSY